MAFDQGEKPGSNHPVEIDVHAFADLADDLTPAELCRAGVHEGADGRAIDKASLHP